MMPHSLWKTIPFWATVPVRLECGVFLIKAYLKSLFCLLFSSVLSASAAKVSINLSFELGAANQVRIGTSGVGA
ncbi:MAG: hypothetical protein M2R45_00199 [Verrucomicrobia subdivision 3 bacterium]|nr:hypothetical protein [Limisphaerales bacterium]MCS1412342.1 hypothetical protein [Limisphaerales bacterium]